ncbi:MAG: membrane protein insertion efficiency factor YidD [bacterium]|nr:membrane protein insertion efficiency factor YidD [bacterium]
MKNIFLALIFFYRRNISRLLAGTIYLTDHSCRFIPTCSQYAYEAVSRYGIIKGVWLGWRRIFRCHPFSRGGVDLLK